ncbi:MAG TPA: hypothetical protein VLR94_07690 [Acidobacteriota bacterium]|nr:hypothetical protein [Acidobacteriota bacterium]
MRKILTLAVLAALLITTGCVDADRFIIRYDIDRNLRGTVTLEFLGIHSPGEKPEEQQQEMKEFYDGGYREEAAGMEKDWSLSEAHTEITNKTPLRCDAKLTGEIEDLVKSLAPLVREGGTAYEIKRHAHRFSFTARGGWSENDKNLSLIITYAGKIVEQNAQKYDEAAHRMEWNLGELTDSGIHFVLEVED